jgi:hypothetical protein
MVMGDTGSGVSGAVQYDIDISCFADEHFEAQQMFPTDELTDRMNTIYECPECGVRRAVDVRVAPLAPKTSGSE